MSDWKKITEERPSADHRARVMMEAAELLKQNKAENPSRRWIWLDLGLLVGGFASLALVMRVFNQAPDEGAAPGLADASNEELSVALADPEMLEDSDLLAELDLLEELEVLEQWDET
ncbi:MAG TPA: hypothetical protein VFV50_03225 [Bdellovibrionales bacterium]|nr:hypothetical protein [Bdellovibrionales bacterium]